jgi:tetratricopeptide (TPR) repeat protein
MQTNDLLKPALRQNWPAAIIIVLGICAYANSFFGVYFPDDHRLIPNTAPAPICPERKGPTAVAFSYGARDVPADPVNLHLEAKYLTRPVVALTLVFNYLLSKTNIWSYHLVNLVLHLLAALVLFGVVRRTLESKALEKYFEPLAAKGLALICALLWLVHPLQTESVTYVMQRSELLAGLFYLLVIYCLIRGAGSEKSGLWLWAGAGAALLGMGAKPVLLTVPVVAFLYDRAFLAGSSAGAWRQRWHFYEKLLIVAALGLLLGFLSPAWQGIGGLKQSWDYFLSECGVILYYLRLALWPNALCLDYWWPSAAHLSQIIPPFLGLFALLAATLWATLKKPALGFLGAWFFLLLAPASSFIPLANKAVEHRLYLPLAALVVAVVLGLYSLGKFIREQAGLSESSRTQLKFFGYEAAVLAVATLTLLTIQRNRDYANPVEMWKDVVKKQPGNPRAYENLGLAYFHSNEKKENKLALAQKAFADALQIDGGYWPANIALGELYELKGDFAQAIPCYASALRCHGDGQLSHRAAVLCNFYARALLNKNPPLKKEAEEQFRGATNFDPQYEPPFSGLGKLLVERNAFGEAIQFLKAADQLIPDRVEEVKKPLGLAYYGVGASQAASYKWDAAVASFWVAVSKYPDYAPAVSALANALAEKNRLDGQNDTYRKTLAMLFDIQKKKPGDPTNMRDISYWSNGLGLQLMGQDKYAEAASVYENAIMANPNDWMLHFNLGLCYQNLNRPKEARQKYIDCLRVDPTNASARSNLGVLLNDNLGLGAMGVANYPEAERYFREACKYNPGYWPAWFNLAKVMQIQNKPSEAIINYKEAYRLNPGNTEALNSLKALGGQP